MRDKTGLGIGRGMTTGTTDPVDTAVAERSGPVQAVRAAHRAELAEDHVEPIAELIAT